VREDAASLFLLHDPVRTSRLDRRVSAASPGGNSDQPFGTVSTLPSAVRTLLEVGPGRNAELLAMVIEKCFLAKSTFGGKLHAGPTSAAVGHILSSAADSR